MRQKEKRSGYEDGYLRHPHPAAVTFRSTLPGDERFDKRVRGLRVQAERVLQALQLRRLLQERHLQPIAAGVEVLLDRAECNFQHGALLGR